MTTTRRRDQKPRAPRSRPTDAQMRDRLRKRRDRRRDAVRFQNHDSAVVAAAIGTAYRAIAALPQDGQSRVVRALAALFGLEDT